MDMLLRHVPVSFSFAKLVTGSRRTLAAISGSIALAALAPPPAHAQMADGLADKREGRGVAERLCSNCHLVAPDAERRDTHIAPPFQVIAGREGQTRERIAGAVIFPHPEMPSIPLTRAEIRDIATYIMSLKPSGGE